jgi:hypothetical protein
MWTNYRRVELVLQRLFGGDVMPIIRHGYVDKQKADAE